MALATQPTLTQVIVVLAALLLYPFDEAKARRYDVPYSNATGGAGGLRNTALAVSAITLSFGGECR